MRAEVVDAACAPRTVLAESPRWDGEAWWWVDAAAGDVWRRGPGAPAVAVRRTGTRTSLVHPEASGRVVIAHQDELLVLDQRADGGWEPAGVWCGLGLGDGWLVNDGVADARGRLWIGTVAPGREPFGGTLLRVDPDGTATTAATGFTLTNGMAWDVDGDRLFHVDSLERTVWAHRVDVVSGAVSERTVFVRFAADDGIPDGVTTDVDGGLWVAVYGTGQVRRYDAAGELDVVIEVETPQCTSVELGGADGRDLLITTAREGYDDDRSAAEPAAGRLYHARSDHAGLAKPKAVAERLDKEPAH